MHTWKDVATLTKTKNLNGRFVARGVANLPFVFEEGLEVAFVPPQLDAPRRTTVNFVQEIDNETCEVGFDAVEDENMARLLVGCHCLVRRADVPEIELIDESEFWTGYEVIQEGGASVGELRGLVDNPGQALLEVERSDGRMALIPLVDEFIVDVDEDARTITVSLPAGLLDL